MINIKWLILDIITFGCYSSYKRIELMDKKYNELRFKKIKSI
jgi:hypothetical protein